MSQRPKGKACALLSRGPMLTGPVREVTFLADDTAELQLLWSQAVLRSFTGREVPVSAILRRALEVYLPVLLEDHQEAHQVLELTWSRMVDGEARENLSTRLKALQEVGELPAPFTIELRAAT